MTSGAKALGADKFSSNDARWMQLALLQSARAQGRTAENPPVGCVLVSAQNHLLATGFTCSGGRPHAEQVALKACEGFTESLKGATAYVTLEPCAHYGQTPPCAQALIEAGIKRVVYSVGDPDSRVDGQGHQILSQAGITVQTGLLAEQARDIMAGFLAKHIKNRPAVTTKIALSTDGFIAKEQNQQSWLTGPVCKNFVHDLRSRHDGILTGIQTILADDPQLNCRLAGRPEDSPTCLIMDSSLRLPPDSQITAQAKQRDIFVFCRPDIDSPNRDVLIDRGVKIVPCTHLKGGRPHPNFILEFCQQASIQSVLIEAGALINKAFFDAGLIDKVIELIAPKRLETGYAGYSPSQNSTSSMVFSHSDRYIESSHRYLGADGMKIWHQTE